MAVNNTILDILKTTRVGRSITNEVQLKSDGVSRFHAEIIVEE
jgi:pSer/pThr/pTyr-binding forkhead associated (FHA) protein